LIIAKTPPAAGYELSIYDAYPAFLWVVIAINIFFSIYTIIRSCDSQPKNCYYGFFSILLIETIILLLPIIRGYYAMSRGGGDIYYHIFVASQISNSGYLPQTDTYPIMHILLSVLQNFFVDFIILAFLLSIIFFISYILYLYILGKTIVGSVRGGIFFSIFGIPLIFSFGHYAFFPFLFALFIIPLILFVYQKIINNSKQQSGFYICLVFLSLFIVFCHPMITIFLIIMFSTFAFYELFKRWKNLSRPKLVVLNIIAIVTVTFFFWFFHFRYLMDSLESVTSALLGQGAYTSILEYQVNTITTSNAPIWLMIDRFIKIYGPICLYFSISLFFLFYIIYQYYQNKKLYENDLVYSLQFCVAICIGIALMTGYFVIFEPIRASMYGLIFASIMCGLFFYRIWFSTKSKKRKLGLISSITVILTIVCMLTMLAIYSSPWTSGTNTAVTYGDKNAIDWILEYRNAEIPVVREEESMYRYSTYYYESMDARKFQNLSEYTWKIPSNFGYNTTRTIGDSFSYLPDRRVYMLTTELMKLTPYAVPDERRNLLKSFTDSDFIRLKNDPTVNLVYTNNQFGVWSINIR
jgi:hypothetical protein